jgi:photosynthesis system II assembly factor YCF48-like protein
MSRLLGILLVLTLCAPALGAQWERSSVPFKPTAISSNGTVLWVCGADSGIASSSDGGLHWEVRNQKAHTAKLSSIGFADAKLGYAGGERGLLLLTIDGGATWQQLPAMFSDSVIDLSFADAQHGIVLTIAAVLYTSDAGKSWQPLASLRSPDLRDFKFVLEIAALGESAAVLLKSGPAQFYDQRLISTHDAGRTWTTVPFEHMTINNLLVAQGEYWVVGTEVIDRQNHGGHAVPVTLHSRDGVSWNRGPKPLIDVNDACRPEGCFMWNGAWFAPFVPNGKIHTFPAWSNPSMKDGRITISTSPSFRANRWAATNTRICSFVPDLQCADAALAQTLPQHGGPAPALGAFELRPGKAMH